VGIRLVGAGARERAAIARQLGPIEKPLDREPDVVIRFVDRLETYERERIASWRHVSTWTHGRDGDR
jgi:hypothetical protein